MVTRNRVGTQSVDSPASTANTPTGQPKNDNRTPNAPATLDGTSGLELIVGVYSGLFTLTWVNPTMATDKTAMTPDIIEIWQVRAGESSWARVSTVAAPDKTVTLHGYGIGASWQFKVRAQGANYKFSAFSNVKTLVTPSTAAAPPKPSIPTLTSRMGIINIAWDGMATGNAAMPADVNHVTIQRYTSAVFPNPDPDGLIKAVAELPAAGTAVDGPFQVDGVTQWFYRLVAVNITNVPSVPGDVAPGIIVQGIARQDIPDGTILNGQLEEKLAADIQKAITSTSGNTTPGNAIYRATSIPAPPASGPYVPNLPGPFNIGDLWFDLSHQNRPMICTTGGTPGAWTDMRDAIVQNAFLGPPIPPPKGDGVTPTVKQAYLLPDVVQTSILNATTLIQAKDIIATGTISSDYGLFGNVDASTLNTGFLKSDVIAANSIVASKLTLADTENLVDEPEFVGGKIQVVHQSQAKAHNLPLLIWGPPFYLSDAWTPALGASAGRIIPVPDHPVAGSAGMVWSGHGTGATGDIKNSRVIPCTQDTEFHGEIWVRKMSQATTGQVQLLANVNINGAVSQRLQLCTKTFTVSDPALQWFKLTGDFKAVQAVDAIPADPGDQTITPPIPATPAVPAVAYVPPLPVGTYNISWWIRITGTVSVNGEVQFASPSVRRRNSSELIVDGAITANKVAAKAISAVNIQAGAIKAGMLSANTVRATDIQGSAIHANHIVAGALDATLITGNVIQTSQSFPKLVLGTVGPSNSDPTGVKGPYVGVAGTYLDYSIVDPKNSAAIVSLFRLNPASGSMYWRGGPGTSPTSADNSMWQLDASGMRLWNAAGTNTMYLQTTGAISMTGPLITTGTITGALVRTRAATTGNSTRIELDSDSLTMFDSLGNAQFQLDQTNGLVTITNKPGKTNDVSLGWVLKDSGMFFYDGKKMTVGLYTDPSNAVARFTGRIIASSIEAGTIDADSSITGANIYGANIMTKTTSPYIQLSATEFRMVTSAGTMVDLNPTAGNIHFDTGPTYPARLFIDETDGIIMYGSSSTDIVFRVDKAGNTTMQNVIIRTDTANPRITMDPANGLRAYDSTGAYMFYATMQGNAYFNGTMAASTVTGTNISGGTITSTDLHTVNLYTSTLNGATVKGTVSGGTYSGGGWSNGGFSGSISNSATITGGLIRTGAGSNRVEMSSDQIRFYTLLGSTTTLAAVIEADGSAVALILRGNTSGGEVSLGDDNQFYVANTGHVFAPAAQNDPISGGQLMSISSSGWMGVIASSARYKQKIAPLAVDPGFMQVRPSTWEDRPSSIAVDARLSAPGNRRFVGFLAEDLHDSRLQGTVIYDRHQRPDSIHFLSVLAHTVRYTQHLVRQVEELSARMAELEGAL